MPLPGARLGALGHGLAWKASPPLLPARPGRAQVGTVLISLSQNCLPGEGVLHKLREAPRAEGSWL